MTDLEEQKQRQQRLQEQNPELRDRQQMNEYRKGQKQRGMLVSMIILAAVAALALVFITFFLREKTGYLRGGVTKGYLIACFGAFALTVCSFLAMRKLTALRAERELADTQLLTEEALIRDGKKQIPLSIAAYAVPLLLLLLWMQKDRLPSSAAAAAYPFIVPIVGMLLIALTAFPLGTAGKAARMSKAIGQGDYQISCDLVCDREHIVEHGGKDENDRHYYYVFYRYGLTGKVEREQVSGTVYGQAQIGQEYYRVRQGDRVLKILPKSSTRLDAALRAHLQQGAQPELDTVSVEDEEIRRQVDSLRVGDRPEAELKPVPEGMDPQQEQILRDKAGVQLRKYDAAATWIRIFAVVNILLIAAAIGLRAFGRTPMRMGAPFVITYFLLAAASAFAEIILITASLRSLQKAKEAFPYKNEELERREAGSGKSILIGILGFMLVFGAFFAMII